MTLISSEDKFQAKGKWAAFRKPINDDTVKVLENDMGGKNLECSSCSSIVGSLFNDGKNSGDNHPSAKNRHLIYSSVVTFEPTDDSSKPNIPISPATEYELKVEKTQSMEFEKKKSNPEKTKSYPEKKKSQPEQVPSKKIEGKNKKPKKSKTNKKQVSLESEKVEENKSMINKTTLIFGALITVIGIVSFAFYRSSHNK